jgi:hypothetical protein
MNGKEKLSLVADGGLVPGQTDRLTVGRKIHLKFSLATLNVGYSNHSSVVG